MSGNKVTRRVVGGLLGGAMIAGVLGVTSPASADTLRDAIVSTAQAELANDSRNYEYRGSDNCTYYSGQITGWPVCNGLGWRGGTSNDDDVYAWCANFSKYIWRQAGVTDLSGLNTWARSFREYGRDNNTWHARTSGYTPQPGDAVVFDWGPQDGVIDHVGIVVQTSGGRVYTIEGNSSNRVSARNYATGDSDIVGYSSPVGADATVDTNGANSVAGDIAVVRTGTGVMAQYRLGTNGWIQGSDQDAAGSAYGTYSNLGNRGDFAGRPAALIAGNDTIVVYARGTDGKVYGIGQPAPGSAFGNWGQIGTGQPTFASDPTVVMTPDGLLAVYATANDGFVWGAAQSAPGKPFGGWVKIGVTGDITSAPQALIAPNDTIVLYARGADGKIRGVGQSAPGAAFGTWSILTSTQPATGFLDAPPTVVLAPGNKIALYATGTDGFVWGTAQSAQGSAFGTWVKIGVTGNVASRPQALVAPNNTIVLYARGTDNKIRGVGQSAPGSAFGTWSLFGTGQTTYAGDPSALVASGNRIVVYSRGTDGLVWGTGQPSQGSAFGAWIQIGG
ncbi:CHAP domain-containing protein [Catellatospora sp. NPDC049609]|uniref:CHAP domain-containing protein n=1 Tax=Catellatospora sp. NPDC049609 TaxID=3155505 RepID=UPI00343A4894